MANRNSAKALYLVFLPLVALLLYLSIMKSQGRCSNRNQTNLDDIMKVFKKKEEQEVKDVLEYNLSNISGEEAMTRFYQVLSFPLQGVCRVMKRVGGRWLDWRRTGYNMQVDGDKYICMDNILTSKSCIIYSFGINYDWTFEDTMSELGCSVYAYDHTISAPPERGERIMFSRLGLGVMEDMDTLDNIIDNNNHADTTIEYLKVDIEGHELGAGGLQHWLQTGVLHHVNQLAMELHLPLVQGDNYVPLLQLLQDLHRLHFRVISHQVNMVMGPNKDSFYNFVEVVFMKDNL